MRFVLNGRFLNRPMTGVERFALELSRALRAALSERGLPELEVVVPAGADVEEAAASLDMPGPIHALGRLHGHAWEQVDLVRATPEAWLLNLCNTGPMARRRQMLVIHDAQFVLHPESYSFVFRSWYRTMLMVAARRAEAVFTVSNFSKTQLERFGIVPRGKAHVLRSGIDHLDVVEPDRSILATHGLDGRPYLLAIGSLAPHKNLAMLVDAFVSANLPEIDLVVAGGGNSRVFQGAGLREAANIRYLGRVSDGELKALYGAAHAFACPSLSEGFGLTPLEAMRMGCPVVATTGGAVPEICGDAAVYADPHDPAAWSAALRRIVEDAALRTSLAARGRKRAATFTWQGAAQQLLGVIASLEHEPRPS
jgi:glycosyltransferase involved in cell wall biosynthesis